MFNPHTPTHEPESSQNPKNPKTPDFGWILNHRSVYLSIQTCLYTPQCSKVTTAWRAVAGRHRGLGFGVVGLWDKVLGVWVRALGFQGGILGF